MADANSTVVYKDIPGFPGYRVGSDGSVWSCWVLKPLGGRRGTTSVQYTDWKQMTPCVTSPGYPVVNIKGKCVRVHTLVLLAFVGPRPRGAHACHNDGTKTNNSAANLRWDTPRGNILDRDKHGTHNKGDRNGRAKVSEELVKRLRTRYAQMKGGRAKAARGTCVTLAAEFHLPIHHVYELTARESWKHLD
jgi:hypothetical protein